MSLASESLNLFLDARARDYSVSIPLFLTGSTIGRDFEFNTLQLYIDGQPFTSELNLYTSGMTEPGSSNNQILLYISGHGQYNSDFLDLVVWGSSAFPGRAGLYNLTLEELDALTLEEFESLSLDEQAAGIGGYHVNNQLSLYIQGEGDIEGAGVSEASLELFLSSPPGVERQLDLWIIGAPPNNSYIDLYTYGIAGNDTNSLNLYLHSIGIDSKSLPLFLRGYTPR